MLIYLKGSSDFLISVTSGYAPLPNVVFRHTASITSSVTPLIFLVMWSNYSDPLTDLVSSTFFCSLLISTVINLSLRINVNQLYIWFFVSIAPLNILFLFKGDELASAYRSPPDLFIDRSCWSLLV